MISMVVRSGIQGPQVRLYFYQGPADLCWSSSPQQDLGGLKRTGTERKRSAVRRFLEC